MLVEGAVVGNYEIEALVGAGGMSGVYRARHRVLRSLHALKILKSTHQDDPILRDRFLKEGQVLAQLHHPALVRVTDVVYDGGVAGLVMDYLEGADLKQRLADGPLSVEGAADILVQVLAAMTHAHEARVFHRDLKPANIFLAGSSGTPDVKVLDFGIAKVADSFVTRGHFEMGTVAYMSPEQIEHPGEIDARADVFSLGAVLFEMVCGQRAFAGGTEIEVKRRIVAGDRRSVTDGAGPLAPIIERALQTNPADRFASADAFRRALWPFVSEPVRDRVEGWSGSGEIHADELDSARGQLESLRPVSRAATPDQRDRMLRILGGLQFASGLVNLGIMSIIQCVGIGWLGGLPACFAGLLVVVGLIEVWSGLQALLFRSSRWIRLAAVFEVFSIVALGIPSTVVGIVVLYLRRRYLDDAADL